MKCKLKCIKKIH